MHEILIYDIRIAMNPRYIVVLNAPMSRCYQYAADPTEEHGQIIKQDKLVAHFHLVISNQEPAICGQVPTARHHFIHFPPRVFHCRRMTGSCEHF